MVRSLTPTSSALGGERPLLLHLQHLRLQKDIIQLWCETWQLIPELGADLAASIAITRDASTHVGWAHHQEWHCRLLRSACQVHLHAAQLHLGGAPSPQHPVSQPEKSPRPDLPLAHQRQQLQAGLALQPWMAGRSPDL